MKAKKVRSRSKKAPEKKQQPQPSMKAQNRKQKRLNSKRPVGSNQKTLSSSGGKHHRFIGRLWHKPTLAIKWLLGSLGLTLVLLTLFLLLRNIRLIQVTDEVMQPVLRMNQYVLFQKDKPIERYDLLVFTYKLAEATEHQVRRVIGLPGDSIWVEGETVFVNHTLSQDLSLATKVYATQLPPGTFTFTVSDPQILAEFSKQGNIPAKQYLVLTEDLSQTADSREYGFISEQRIRGVVVLQ